MGRTLLLEVPDEIYGPLVQTAQTTGHAPEDLALEWLQLALRNVEHDPLEEFIGALAGPPSDWADQHDDYLGHELIQEMLGQGEVDGPDA
jgi:hypothetical protein